MCGPAIFILAQKLLQMQNFWRSKIAAATVHSIATTAEMTGTGQWSEGALVQGSSKMRLVHLRPVHLVNV